MGFVSKQLCNQASCPGLEERIIDSDAEIIYIEIKGQNHQEMLGKISWSCRKPQTYTSINWTKPTNPIPRELSKNQCFTTSSTNFIFKDEKTSGTFENDFGIDETGLSLAIDKDVIG